MSDYIVSLSGFIFKENNLFVKAEKSMDYKESILGKFSNIDLYPKLKKLVASGDMHTSPIATQAYLEYVNDPTAVNYIRLIDIFADVMDGDSLLALVKNQTNNPYLSPIGFNFCMDVLDHGQFLKSHMTYEVMPTFFNVIGNLTKHDEFGKRPERLERFLKSRAQSCGGFIDEITCLVQNKKLFTSFFKFLLVDFNKGGSYV